MPGSRNGWLEPGPVPSTAAPWLGLEAMEARVLLSAASGDAGDDQTLIDRPAARVATALPRRRVKRAAAARLVIKDGSVTEGDPGQVRQMTFKVVRQGSLVGTSQARFTAAKTFIDGVGTATEDVDFNAKSGKIVFAPGVKTRTITIGVIGDNIDEGDEQFTVTLTKPKGASLQRSTATGTIVNNDAGKTVDVTISNDNFTPDESATYPPELLAVQLTFTNSGNADSGVTAVQFQLLVDDGANIIGTAALGSFILVPNVPANDSITVDFVLDFNRAFIFNDRWDVYAKVLIEDDDPTNNTRFLGDIQITLPT